MIKFLLLYLFCFSAFPYDAQQLHKGNSPEIFRYVEKPVAYHLTTLKEIDVEKEQAHEEQKQCVIDLALVCFRYYRLCREYHKLDVPTCSDRFEQCMKTQIINSDKCWEETGSNGKSRE